MAGFEVINEMKICNFMAPLMLLIYKVFIDGNGDAEGNYTVISYMRGEPGLEDTLHSSYRRSNDTRNLWNMRPVGYFQQSIVATTDSAGKDIPV